VEVYDFETHFYTKSYVNVLLKNRGCPRYVRDEKRDVYWLHYTPRAQEPHARRLLERLLDVEEKRLRDMDYAGVKVQVLSLSAPGCEQFGAKLGSKLARAVNDELSRIVDRNPDRFIGLAALAPQDPGEAADELERAVRDLGFKGWKTHSNIRGEYLDSKKFWPVLERAEKLGVPIFIHPTIPWIRELSEPYGYTIAGPAFGFVVEPALCVMRLIWGGVFDRFPNLKVVLGHFGEALPFLIDRIDFPRVRPWVYENLEFKILKRPSEYLKNNVYILTSGAFPMPAVTAAVQIMGSDRVMFGSDYPYEDSAEAVKRFESLPLSREDKEKIYALNAKRLLKVD
jgi:predicted TIM-barrel fold metal-dependent hydrolase